MREPRQVLREFGTDLSKDIELIVHDSNADMRYLVLPEAPGDVSNLNAAELEALVTRDRLIGVAR